MDIRRFLVPEKPSDGRARTDKAPAKVERKKPSSKRRRIALMSDSDEDEDFASTKKKEKTQEGMGIKGKIKDEPNDKDGRPAKIASVLSKKGSDPTGGKRIVMSAEDFFSSQAKPAKSTPPVEPTKPQTPGTSRIKMRLETFKRQDRNKEVEKVKPQTEDDHSPSKRHKKVSESRQKPPVVVEAVKPVIETKEVEEKEEGISTVIPSPKRSLSDSSGVKDRGSPVKPGMKKSTSDSSRKSYKDFLQRQGPTQLGTKQLPEAGENCLEGQTFVVTGVLESFERDDIIDYIKRYGGKISQQVGKRTSYCIVGRDAGPAKLEKIKQFNTKSLNEDEFLSLMQSLPSKQTKYFSTPTKQLKPPSTADKTTKKTKKTPKKNENQTKTTKPVPEVVPVPVPDVSPVSSSSTLHMECVTWADKYRPKSTKEIIGQQGEKSNVKKLGQWLENWHQQQNKGKTGGGGRKDGGSMFKAALLSGPPGVGKTTSASLVCQEKGFTYIELNASDTRNKSTLQETVKDALGIYDIASIVKGDHSGKNQALIMDEVDGMSGNEDRGGIQELISLIKSTQIPIICICNDRNHPKIRSLANHCFDLRFQRPRIEQIKGAIMKIAFKENVNVKAPAIEQIAVAANGDIRQTLHHLYMWSASGKTLSYDEAKDHSNSARKQLNLTPFEAVKKVFAPDTQRLSLIDQSELFFQDYSMMPLFVQENYLSVTPMNARDDPHKALQLFSKAAESLSWFDVTDHTIRTSGDWGLLPLQANPN
jgi:replication factor C subunit 1